MKYAGRASLFLIVLLVMSSGIARSEDIRAIDEGSSVSQQEAVIDYWRLNLNFMVGAKFMDNRDLFGDIQRLDAFDLSIDFGRESWPAHFIFGASSAFSKENVKANATTSYNGQMGELYAGARKYIRLGGFHPYLGAGIGNYTVNLDKIVNGVKTSDSDQSYGYFFNAGVLIRLSTSFHFGFDFRQFTGNKLRLKVKPGVEGNASYINSAAFIGIHW